jgi:hypothetical protein
VLVIQRTTAIAAIAAGLIRLLIWPAAARYAVAGLLTGLERLVGDDERGLWLMLLTGTVAVGGLVAGWIVDRWSQRRGALLVEAGTTVALQWWLLSKQIAVVDFSFVDVTDPVVSPLSGPCSSGQPSPSSSSTWSRPACWWPAGYECCAGRPQRRSGSTFCRGLPLAWQGRKRGRWYDCGACC